MDIDEQKMYRLAINYRECFIPITGLMQIQAMLRQSITQGLPESGVVIRYENIRSHGSYVGQLTDFIVRERVCQASTELSDDAGSGVGGKVPRLLP